MDQFTYAERATDWRGNNNIAESIFRQLGLERFPEPAWIVATAGTGGTSATLARYVHYMQRDTRVCVADPENSCFFDGWTTGDPDVTCDCGSRIEGIGRPRMEPSFVPGAIDRMMKVPDAASVAAVRALEQAIGRKAGGSTGTGLWSALKIVAEMVADGRQGSVVTLLCDPGDRYLDKYYSDAWLAEQGLDIAPYTAAIEHLLATGVWPRLTPGLGRRSAGPRTARRRSRAVDGVRGRTAPSPAAPAGPGPGHGTAPSRPRRRSTAPVCRPPRASAATPRPAPAPPARWWRPPGRRTAPASSPRAPSPGTGCRPADVRRAPRRRRAAGRRSRPGTIRASPRRRRRAPGRPRPGERRPPGRRPCAPERSRRSRALPDADDGPWRHEPPRSTGGSP